MAQVAPLVAKIKTGGDLLQSVFGMVSTHGLEEQKYQNAKGLMDKNFAVYKDKFDLHKQQYNDNGIPFLPGSSINETSFDHVGNNRVYRNMSSSKMRYQGTQAQNHLGVGRFW